MISSANSATHPLAAFAPKLGRRQERIGRHDDGTEHDAPGAPLREFRELAGDQPDGGSGRERTPQDGTAVKQPRRVPDHAAGDEQQRVGGADRQGRPQQALDAPRRHREPADQVGRPPPGKRTHAILGPGEQQKDPEQRGDAGCDREQGGNVQHDR